MRHTSVLLLLLLLVTALAYEYKNVALRGKATQSHRLQSDFSVDAYNAIDGNRNSDLRRGSCTHTGPQAHPWWRVDLLETYVVTSISVTNRGDCCSENINGAGIHVGNSLQDDGTSNPVVAVISGIPPGRTLRITFTSPVEGRYVIVSLPGFNRVLTLCEVEIYGYRAPTGENIAIYGKATQSSLHTHGKASCSHTIHEFNPWCVTSSVEAYLRLQGAEIRIGDSLNNNGNNNPRCAAIGVISPGFTQNFQCNGMNGQYINIVIPGRTEYLILCEVEVYASRLD
uniref:Si:ch211-215k15.4 n=1 Tax=Xiphophorus maculatus TaxID=8083 RepID=A0A3B5QEB1_XIPMA